MCTYQTLYHNDQFGYVILCNECNTLQVNFGNIALTLTRNDFYALGKWARDSNLGDAEKPGLKSIILPTPCSGVKLSSVIQNWHC